MGILVDVNQDRTINQGPDHGEGVFYSAKKSAKIQFASTILMLEAFVVLFATLAVFGLRAVPKGVSGSVPDVSAGVIWAVGGGLAVILIVLGRMVSRPGGYIAGTVAQVPVLLSGFLVPMMFIVGTIFVIMWFVALHLGVKIDRERVDYDAAHPETAPR